MPLSDPASAPSASDKPSAPGKDRRPNRAKSPPEIPVRLGDAIHGSFEPSHADRAPIAHGRAAAGSVTSTVTRARSPEAESCTSLTPLLRGSSVTSACESAAAAATSPIARPLVVAVKSASVVRLPYASRATTRSTRVSRVRTATLPTTGARPRSTTSSCAGPGSAYTVAVRLNVPTLAVITTAPARSGSVTRTRTVPAASASAALGVTAPADTANAAGCLAMGAPVGSRTSSTMARAEPAAPCCPAPRVNWVRSSAGTGRGGGGGGAGAGGGAWGAGA